MAAGFARLKEPDPRPRLSPDDLAATIQDATAAVNLARHTWQRTGGESDWNWLQACVCHRDMLLREARHLGLEAAPAVEEPVRFSRPWRTLGIGLGGGAALVVGCVWGGAGLHGAMVLLAVFAALGWVVLK